MWKKFKKICTIKKNDEPLIVTTKEAYPAIRRFLVYSLVIALGMSPMIDNPAFKAAVISSLAVTLLFLFFDIYNQLDVRLKQIGDNVSAPNPPTWSNYGEAQAAILAHIVSELESGKDLNIEVIGVSARFSSRMIEDHFTPLVRKYTKSKFRIDIAVSTKSTLESWHLDRWIVDLERTINGIKYFANENSADIASGRLIVTRYDYDNLPQWHGVLINKEVLFMGRTEWIERIDDTPDLKVGQCPYRRFELMDRFGGAPRIEMFANWMNRLRRRHEELYLLEPSLPAESKVPTRKVRLGFLTLQ